ncbi:MFS transporter [Rouxiella badensis]|uniref:EmrB/QacA family drug resistance transporter n=1 Tax=Rouxiella badensis TaxID=1646377 RepID=A0A1X0WGC4_9GAMM|nr:MFS transporter [Rouxiella badensis]ORJ25773.1 EmrB/QacA family drug resistance transporter [Rouxiella badensis]WAT04582.1 MFS transporter [Rouxiella badensis]
MIQQTTQVSPAIPAPPPPQPFTLRLVIGLIGILIASLFSGLNDRVSDIALADVRGALNISSDPGSWAIGAYQAAEVAAMMLAPWFAMTFSLRRFAIGVASGFSLVAAVLPYSPNISVFIALRIVQGIFGGALPPLLMTAALRFLPPGIKLYGLSAYALTATFGPNIATTLAAYWTDVVGWQWVFWQVIPPCLLAASMVSYGIPQDPSRFERFKQMDVVGMLTGSSGIALLVLVLQQGERLDWLSSPLIVVMLLSSVGLLSVFFVNEWSHPLPLFKLQMLKRHNLSHGLLTLGGLMTLVLSGSALPSSYMESVQGFRAVQVGPLSLTIGLPQLLLAPLVATVLNFRWIDSRYILLGGLGLIGVSCYGGSHLTESWARENFYWLQIMQAFGQPMAILPVLMGATGVVQPPEGPFASAMFNTVRGLGSVLGTAVVGEFSSQREQFHSNVLLNHAGSVSALLSQPYDGDGTYLAPLNPEGSAVSTEALSAFSSLVKRQATVLGLSDSYLMIIGVAIALALLTVLLPKRAYPPQSLVKKAD